MGKKTDNPRRSQPDLLQALPRRQQREKLGFSASDLPFMGADLWNAYELSYLNSKGKPQALTGRFIFPCEALCLVESKSLKLYLNSLNQERFETREQFREALTKALSEVAQEAVQVSLSSLEASARLAFPEGNCLDDLDLEMTAAEVQPDFLELDGTGLRSREVDEQVFTNLFRCNCPLTGQPDWATVSIRYRGRKISHAGLLRYLVSYRLHRDYHENCVERIFCDLLKTCAPESLTVAGNFLRRGGLDINPLRTTEQNWSWRDFHRHIRQ